MIAGNLQVRRVLPEQESAIRQSSNIPEYSLGDVHHFVGVGGGELDGILAVLDDVVCPCGMVGIFRGGRQFHV